MAQISPAQPSPPATAAADGRRALAVAVAAAGEAARRGTVLPPGLLVCELAGLGDRPPPVPAAAGGEGAGGGDDPPDDPAAVLGACLEAATDGGRRRVQGLHVTPRWLADELVVRGLPGASLGRPGGPPEPTVCDPACGGGAFLVAAARRLHALGLPRRHVVRRLLWGADVDPVGLAAAEAALALWAGEAPPPGRLVVGDPLRDGVAAWPDPPPGGFGAVLGNPPFQNQLGRATARTDAARRALRARYGAAVRPYTDTAWLFLLLGCDLARPGGRVVLVQPHSVVGARDAAPVREAVAARADLRDLWLDQARVFSAAVHVCAPVLERRSGTAAVLRAASPGARPAPADWSGAWARATALPGLDLAPATGGGGTLGDRAAVLAGFRDEYYGLVAAVRERADLAPGDPSAPLVTGGLVDWAACAWGTRPARYARRRWVAPVVDPARLADGPRAARRWVARCAAPKLVVATQTRVVEAAPDTAGGWVPSVPALAVVPHDPDDLWHLAAAVLAPAATAWVAHRAGGTGLGRGALKVAKADLAALPLPADRDAWDAAAAALRGYVADPGPGRLDRYLDAAAAAFGTGPVLTTWWRERSASAVRGGGVTG